RRPHPLRRPRARRTGSALRRTTPLPPPRLPDACRPTDRTEHEMPSELTARTEAGARLVALAEALADEIAPQAAAHDRDASFPFDSFATVKQSRFFVAPVPEELGGLGVTSTHDVVV